MAQKPNTTSTSPSKWKRPAVPGKAVSEPLELLGRKVWRTATANSAAAMIVEQVDEVMGARLRVAARPSLYLLATNVTGTHS